MARKKKLIKVDCVYWNESTLFANSPYLCGYCTWSSTTIEVPNSMMEYVDAAKKSIAKPNRHRLLDARNCDGCRCKKEVGR